MKTRGERNNNPGNIVQSANAWIGKIVNPTDDRFEQFTSPEYGVRALAKNLLTYQNSYGLYTVRAIINKWAPPSENNTNAYVDAVANYIGILPNTTINLNDENMLMLLVSAIIQHENGRIAYPVAQIQSGVDMALA